MNTINMRIGNLELRIAHTIEEHSKCYLEIIQWYKPENCITIAIFEKNDEGHYLKSVGDRIILEPEDWKILGVLVSNGFQFLKDDAKQGLHDE